MDLNQVEERGGGGSLVHGKAGEVGREGARLVTEERDEGSDF